MIWGLRLDFQCEPWLWKKISTLEMSVFNIQKQMVFYGAYHSNPINKFIHIICVPTLLATALVWLHSLGSLDVVLNIHSIPILSQLTFGHVMVGIMALYYLVLETTAALLYLPILYGMAQVTLTISKTLPHANMKSLIIHIVAWILQFIGHGVFEKRAPALLDSAAQAFLLAPFFVWLEVLFLLGYNKSLHQQIWAEAKKEIAVFRRKLGKKVA